MSNVILDAALAKIEPGSAAIDAPEWSKDQTPTLIARFIIAALLLAFAGMIAWQAPGGPLKESDESSLPIFQVRVTEATEAVEVARERRMLAAKQLKRSRTLLTRSREQLNAVRQARPGEANTAEVQAVRGARAQRAVDRATFVGRAEVYRQKVAERSAALNDFVSLRRDSDIDLVRAVGTSALALLALLAAGALLAPRRSASLRVRTLLPETGAAVAAALPPGGSSAVGGPDPSDGAPAATHQSEGPAPESAITQTEPALAQAVVASGALIAGLFGIQEFEGSREVLLNIAIPLIPIVGALFTRNRVAAKPHIRAAERRRLFGSR